ncbi:hypothetical protein SAMN05216516_101607 [Izhakiella capsodis]|uniref:Uncharacterized protein n=1 Tax=Izhakiella capsodis TaxID=1367852 RepID=A0A1I4V891_9GAMM|nr:hypothetical protein [Izhakiella capsodis]SFM97417.1 hypothetical protein SAMN05216516_101607 [Izhakiella capsodis]
MKLKRSDALSLALSITAIFSSGIHAAENQIEIDDSGLTVNFSAAQSKKIYHYLEKVREQEGYVVSSGAAGSVYLSSPAVTCKRTDPGNLGRSEKNDSADLYSCMTRINQAGLSEQP